MKIENKVQKTLIILGSVFAILLAICCSSSNKKPKKLSLEELDSVTKKLLHFSRFSGEGHDEIIDMYIQSGADPNAKDSNGTPAIMLAVIGRSSANVKALLKYNPEVNFISEGMTPLIMAAGLGKEEIVKMLIEHGADIHAKDTMGNTALINAVGVATMIYKYGALEASKVLIEKGANVNDIGYDSMNVLQFAVEMGQTKIVKLLLENGADLKHKDKKGRTALSIAKEGYNSELINLLDRHQNDRILKKREEENAHKAKRIKKKEI